MNARVLAGVFVGGASRRMGGAKGLLMHRGERLVDGWRRRLEGRGHEVVLVGARPEYAEIGLRALADEPAGIGPIGGVRALLACAGDRLAFAVACDMPFVSDALLSRLLEPGFERARVPRRAGVWEPLCAVYDARACLAAVDARILRGEHGLQGWIDSLDPTPFDVPPEQAGELDDWDTPIDVARAGESREGIA